MNIFVGVLVGLFVLMTLVTLHELGHFIAARRNGVRVLEFGIGFPPKAIAWVKDPKTKKWTRLPKQEWDKPQKGLIFSLNWLPIGGFCQMDGESAFDEREGTFGAASFLKKTKILFAGVAMNWLTAFVILTILAWVGMPNFIDGQFTIDADTRVERMPVKITKVIEGSPAEKAGLLTGDYLISVDGNKVASGSEVIEYDSQHAGGDVTYEICPSENSNCGDESSKITIRLNSSDSEYLLGIAMQSSEGKSYSTWSAPIVGAGLTLQITGETFRGVGQLVWNLVSGIGQLFSFDANIRESGQAAISTVGDSVSGPVGIIGVLFPAFTSAGPANLAFLAAIISISLACMNVLPIPALDGGRWLLIAIYKVRRKRLTKEVEEKIVARAFVVLLALMLIVTVLDITRFFR